MAYSVKELLDAARARLKVAFEQVDTDGGDPVLAPVNVVRTAEGEALSVQLSGSSVDLRGLAANKPAADAVEVGVTYWSVDTGEVEVSDGTTWNAV